jgi:hypothetical protein
MLTGFQVATGAYRAEYGEVICESCFDSGDTYCIPVSNYELDEWQSTSGADGYCAVADEPWDNYEAECGCEPPLLCDSCGNELREAWEDEYWHEQNPQEVEDDDAEVEDDDA